MEMLDFKATAIPTKMVGAVFGWRWFNSVIVGFGEQS